MKNFVINNAMQGCSELPVSTKPEIHPMTTEPITLSGTSYINTKINRNSQITVHLWILE